MPRCDSCDSHRSRLFKCASCSGRKCGYCSHKMADGRRVCTMPIQPVSCLRALQTKESPREVFECPDCNRRESLPSSLSHWCECSPRASFRMVPVSVSRAVHRAVGSTLPSLATKGGPDGR